ncbi:MAG: hypothetical protein WBD31_13635 [Rubripirellula sp.]
MSVLTESDFVHLAGTGDYQNMVPGTLLVSQKPAKRPSSLDFRETFARFSRLTATEALVVRVIASADLINTGTELEPKYSLGDHLFAELQSPVASGLVSYQLNPLWVVRLGMIVDGNPSILAQQTSLSTESAIDFTADAITLFRGSLLWDWTDSRRNIPTNSGAKYSTLTLAGDVDLVTLYGQRSSPTSFSPEPIYPVAYLAKKDTVVTSGESSTTVLKGKVFRLRSGQDPAVLSSWEIADRVDDFDQRPTMIAYSPSVSVAQATRIQETHDWPTYGHVGVQSIVDDPDRESYSNAIAKRVFSRFESNESQLTPQTKLRAFHSNAEQYTETTQVTFAVSDLDRVIGADLIIANDDPTVAYQLAVVVGQEIANMTAFEAVFAAADPVTPATDLYIGQRVDVTESVLAIAAANPTATHIDALIKLAGSGDGVANVRSKLALLRSVDDEESNRPFDVQPVRSLSTENEIDVESDTAPTRVSYTVDGDENEFRTTSIARFRIVDLANATSIKLSVTRLVSPTATIPFRIAIATDSAIETMVNFDGTFAGLTKFDGPSAGETVVHEIITQVQALAPGQEIQTAAIMFDKSDSDDEGESLIDASIEVTYEKPYTRSVTGIGVRETTIPLQSYCVDANSRPWSHSVITEPGDKLIVYPPVTFAASFDPTSLSKSACDQIFAGPGPGWESTSWTYQSTLRTPISTQYGNNREEKFEYYYRGQFTFDNGPGLPTSTEFGTGILAVTYFSQAIYDAARWQLRTQFRVAVSANGSGSGVNNEVLEYEENPTDRTTTIDTFGSTTIQSFRDFFDGRSFTATYAPHELD